MTATKLFHEVPEALLGKGQTRSRRRSLAERGAGVGLLERDRELEQLSSAVAAARDGRGSLVVIEGPAGLGKSRLLRWATERGRGMGALVLSAISGEPERDFAFGVTRQLFERHLAGAGDDERRELLAGAAALAWPLLAGEHWGRVQAPDATASEGLLHGLFWLVVNLTERSPLLLAIDDLQWADHASLRFLLYLVQRADDLPLAILTARRPAATTGLVAELAGHPEALRISLRPLSLDAVTELLRQAFMGPTGDGFASACLQATGGNPFLVQAMIKSLREDGIEPVDANLDRVAELRPETVRQQALIRISRLGEDAVALASAAAILGDDALIGRVAAIAGLEPDIAARAADALVQADILSQAAPVRFAHPLLRTAVYEELPAARRGRWHVRAARLLHDEHAPSELVASQVVSGTRVGEAWAVNALRDAARRALRAGSPESTIRYLTRLLTEPLPRETRADALVELARAKAMVGEESAEQDLRDALTLIDAAPAQARALQALGSVLYNRGQTERAAHSFGQALALLHDSHDPLARDLHAAYFSAASLVPELAPQAIEHIAPLLARQAGGETQAERGALAGTAVYQALAGAPREQVIELARRAWGDGKLLADEGPDGWAWSMVTGALSWTGELRASLEISQQVIVEARRRGSLMAYATASFCALEPAHLLGLLDEARAYGEAAWEARRYGWRTYEAALAASHARTLVEQGELEAAERHLAILDDPACGTPPGRAWARAVRGRVRLLQGRPREALSDLLAAGEVFGQLYGEHDTFAFWRGDAALAAHLLGRHEQAQELLAQAAQIVEQTGTPSHRAAVLRTRAAIGASDESVGLLEAALGILEASESRTEYVHCLAELGAALRRAGRRSEARARLIDAVDEAHRMGLRLVEEQAQEELKVAGARPRRLAFSGADSLTASERRVANMAAQGQANREIAQALFVTPRTVEQHLYNTYKKLGIQSRAQLAPALKDFHDPPDA